MSRLPRAALVAATILAVLPSAAPARRALPSYSHLGAPVTDAPAGPDGPSSFFATLPNGRRVTPAGESVVVGASALNALLTPDGRYLVTTNDSERNTVPGCNALPCPTFSNTTQNGAGLTPPGYTLSVVRVDGSGPPAVVRAAAGRASTSWTRVPEGPVGHRQIALPGFNYDTAAPTTAARAPDRTLRSLWLGLALKPLTDTSAELYAAGGPNNIIGAYTLDWSNPSNIVLRVDATVRLPEPAIPSSNDDANRGLATPGGLVLAGDTLWVINNDADNVQRFDVSAPRAPVAVGGATPVGFFPYGGALAAGKLFVTNWGVADRLTNDAWRATATPNGMGQGTPGIGGGATAADSLFAVPVTDEAKSSSVSVLDAATGTPMGSIPLGRPIDGREIAGGTHPSAIVAGPDGFVYVANTNEDTIAVIDSGTGELVRKVALPSPAPPGLLGERLYGLQPNALAYDGAARRLYVAEAGLNSVAVMDATDPAEPVLAGRIPTGWYPTALVLAPDGGTLYVVNAKGSGNFFDFPGETRIEDDGFRPPFEDQPGSEFDVNFQFGTVQRIPLQGLDLDATSQQVRRNTVDWTSPRREHVLRDVAERIDHVFYILKENKTYDSYFGDDDVLNARGADGWPGYAMWGGEVPNMRRLAEQFAIGDNVFADAEESNAGHQFVLGGQTTDFLQKTSQSRNTRLFVHVKNEDPEDYPLTGYLFNNLARSGVSFRDYGDNTRVSGYDEGRNPAPCEDDPGQQPSPGEPCTTEGYRPRDTTSPTIGLGGRYATTVPAPAVLAGNIDVNYPGWNTRITDQRRAREFVKDMGRRIEQGTVPRFTFIWLPQDHTGGTFLNLPEGVLDAVPEFQVRDGDAATGQVVDFLSHSRIWPRSAILIAEDDAQGTADHVYAHRTYAMVVSPWARREAIVHTLASTVSVTKTAELLLGVPPMTYGDAMANDMRDWFTTTPDYTPYDVVGAPALRYAGESEARASGVLRGTPGRVRAIGRPMKVRKAPRLALRISRLMGRLDGGMDRDTTRTGAIGALYMRSVRLARSHRLHGAAYRRAQDRLLRQAWAVVRSGGGDGDD